MQARKRVSRPPTCHSFEGDFLFIRLLGIPKPGAIRNSLVVGQSNISGYFHPLRMAPGFFRIDIERVIVAE